MYLVLKFRILIEHYKTLLDSDYDLHLYFLFVVLLQYLYLILFKYVQFLWYTNITYCSSIRILHLSVR